MWHSVDRITPELEFTTCPFRTHLLLDVSPLSDATDIFWKLLEMQNFRPCGDLHFNSRKWTASPWMRSTAHASSLEALSEDCSGIIDPTCPLCLWTSLQVFLHEQRLHLSRINTSGWKLENSLWMFCLCSKKWLSWVCLIPWRRSTMSGSETGSKRYIMKKQHCCASQRLR